MREKFIQLTNGSDEIYVDPQMISFIRKGKINNSVTLYLFGGQSIGVNEDLPTVLKLIKKASNFKFTFDTNDNNQNFY